MPTKILLIDDDEAIRSEFKDYFQEYDIIEAADGPQALKILNRPNEIDLIILDFQLPGMNGIELLHKIKDINSELSIIIITGHGSKEVVINALRGKADDYVEKPFNPLKVQELIEKLLGKKLDKTVASYQETAAVIERVRAFIERNCLKKITLDDVSRAVYLSPKYLSRLFKQTLKINFCAYKLKIKIEKAKEFLVNSHDSIDQISDKVGYQNTESFIRIFKKLTGFNPTHYRNKYKKTKLHRQKKVKKK